LFCRWWNCLNPYIIWNMSWQVLLLLSPLLSFYLSSPLSSLTLSTILLLTLLLYQYSTTLLKLYLSSPNTETFVASSMQKDACLVVCCFLGHQARYLHHLGWVQSVCPQCAGKCAPKVQNSWGSFCGSWGSQLKKNPSSTSPYLTSLLGWSGRQSILLVSDVGKMWWCCW
jgi:hypothetical protein